MQPKETLQSKIMRQLLNNNSNPEGYKQVINKVSTGVQDRVFWYFTNDQAQFLSNIYVKQVKSEILRNRIIQITDQKMSEVFQQIETGKLKKVHQDPPDQSLYVKLGIQERSTNLSVIEEGMDHFSPNHPRIKENRLRLKQINQDYQKFKERIEEMKRKHRQKQLQKMAIEDQIKRSIQKEKKNEYREEVKKKIQDLRAKEEERKLANEKFKQFLKQFKKSKPLHVMMEEEYKEKFQLPQIQESRRKLEAFKQKKKPTLEQINQHQRTYLEHKAQKPPKEVVVHHTIDVSFKSHFYEQEQEKMKSHNSDDESESSPWDHLQKQRRYSLFVKQKFKPHLRKVNQSIDQTKSQSNLPKESPDRSKVIEIGKQYLEYMRNLDKNRSSLPPPPLTAQSRYMNYLEELKGRHDSSLTTMDWERDMKDRTVSKLEKREKVLMKSKQLEQKAMREQKFVANYTYGKPEQIIERKKEIDETLLSSIKAKVAVLRDAQLD